jgi:hypothetical protein
MGAGSIPPRGRDRPHFSASCRWLVDLQVVEEHPAPVVVVVVHQRHPLGRGGQDGLPADRVEAGLLPLGGGVAPRSGLQDLPLDVAASVLQAPTPHHGEAA